MFNPRINIIAMPLPLKSHETSGAIALVGTPGLILIAWPERRDSSIKMAASVVTVICSNGIGAGLPVRMHSEKERHSATCPLSWRNHERTTCFLPRRTSSRWRKSSSTATLPDPKTSTRSLENVRSPLQRYEIVASEPSSNWSEAITSWPREEETPCACTVTGEDPHKNESKSTK